MLARCQIRMRGEQTRTLSNSRSLRVASLVLRFPTDSKTLISLPTPNVPKQHLPVGSFRANGLERAFSEMPANSKVFHPEAARRDL
jgi:hypothetical protein